MYHRDRYVPPEIGPWVQANAFLRDTYVRNPVPYFYEDKQHLPQPLWQGHDSVIRLYYYAWEVAFGNFIRPNRESKFIADFVETAFNSHLFMWDSAFITIFCQYGHRLFPAIRTLDNFYAKQHPDGYICRQIIEVDGSDVYAENDPDSTGPNIMSWVEWLHYLRFGDKERLQKVFAPLYAYHLWYRRYRAWPDGTYWATGWASGLDNSARVPDSEHYHQYWSWADATAQQALDAKMLANIGELCSHHAEAAELREEYARLRALINEKFWDEESGFYYDRPPDGKLGSNKAITSYWTLLADLVPEDRIARFVAHLEDPHSFKRLHRVPSLAADASGYTPTGAYWLGGVWAPTNYMVVRGLVEHGYRKLAHEIALNHLDNITQVYRDTQTIWENYAPDLPARGNLSRPKFVGWSGLGPIAMLIENVFGIDSCALNNTVTWDIRLPEPHGVVNLPFDADCETTLRCSAAMDGKRVIHAQANRHYRLLCTWQEQDYEFDIAPGDQFFELPSGRRLRGKQAEAKSPPLPQPALRREGGDEE